MRLFVTVLLLALGWPMWVQAQTLVYEDAGKPLFAVEFPPEWLVDTDFLDEARAAGNVDEAGPRLRILEAMPVDGSKLWLGFWVVPRVSTLSEAIDYLASLDGELFTDVARTPPTDRSLNGMPAKSLTGTALRQGEGVEFAVVLFEPRPQTVAMALYVGRPETWKRHRAALTSIRESLAPARSRPSR